MVDVKISKALSWILRHGAESQGLNVLSGGWVHLKNILDNPKFKKFTIEDVKRVVDNCPKQRFALKEEDGQYFIKANQGHTFQIEDPTLDEITLESDVSEVVHGTYLCHWDSIKQQGLSRMKRTHIHFAPGLPGESGVISGMRESSQIFVYIDLPKALQAGFKFYKSANNVILCGGNDKGFIPDDYFLKVVEKRTGRNLI